MAERSPFDPISVRDAILRIRGLIERKQIKQQAIVEAAKIEKSKLSRWLNERSSWSSIGAENYGRILEFLGSEGLFDSGSYARPEEALMHDMAFHSMAMFFGGDQQVVEATRQSLEGHYVGWRYSLFVPPDILKGRVDIRYDETTHALKTYEHFRVPAGLLGSESPEINFKRDGYIWPTAQNMFQMISKKVGYRDIQVAYFNKSLVDISAPGRGKVHTIEGVVTDWQSSEFYMTKFLLQRLAKPLADDEIGVRSEKDVPAAVLAKLKERFRGPHYFLRVYK